MGERRDIRAGDLNRRITIKQPVYNASGDEQIDWAVWGVLWAAKDPIQGRELYTAMRETNEQFTTFVIRYRQNLPTTLMKVFHNTQEYDIRAVMNMDGGNETVDLITRLVSG